jgi:hypothetical protein
MPENTSTPAPMSLMQFLTSPTYGCCTSGELIAYNKQDKEGYFMLRKWAEDEMKNRGIELRAS